MKPESKTPHMHRRTAYTELRTARANQPHQPNRRTGSNTTNTTHLNSTPHTSKNIITPRPTAHNTGLDVSKHQQGNGHHADTPVQGNHNLRDDKVWNERYEPANEITQCKGDGRGPGLVAVRLCLAVVECKQELAESVLRGMQVAYDILDSYV